MTDYVSAQLRRLVQSRANHLCEYCLIHEDDTYLGCQVDHIVSLKHGGRTDADNLAYACTFCNRSKGSDIGSIALSTNQFTRFYNPRLDRWADHFMLIGARIEPLTPIGEITSLIFEFNRAERVLERELLRRIDRYPCKEAVARIYDRS
ncbi:MAG: HNH endonuclease signature motif containing protein [Planctomycetaceae bacterium]